MFTRLTILSVVLSFVPVESRADCMFTCNCDGAQCPLPQRRDPSCKPCDKWCSDHCSKGGGGAGGAAAATGVGAVLNQQAGNLGAAAGAAIGNWLMGGSKKEERPSGPSPQELAAQQEAQRQQAEAEAQRRAQEEKDLQAAQQAQNQQTVSQMKSIDDDGSQVAPTQGIPSSDGGMGFKSIEEDTPRPLPEHTRPNFIGGRGNRPQIRHAGGVRRNPAASGGPVETAETGEAAPPASNPDQQPGAPANAAPSEGAGSPSGGTAEVAGKQGETSGGQTHGETIFFGKGGPDVTQGDLEGDGGAAAAVGPAAPSVQIPAASAGPAIPLLNSKDPKAERQAVERAGGKEVEIPRSPDVGDDALQQNQKWDGNSVYNRKGGVGQVKDIIEAAKAAGANRKRLTCEEGEKAKAALGACAAAGELSLSGISSNREWIRGFESELSQEEIAVSDRIIANMSAANPKLAGEVPRITAKMGGAGAGSGGGGAGVEQGPGTVPEGSPGEEGTTASETHGAGPGAQGAGGAARGGKAAGVAEGSAAGPGSGRGPGGRQIRSASEADREDAPSDLRKKIWDRIRLAQANWAREESGYEAHWSALKSEIIAASGPDTYAGIESEGRTAQRIQELKALKASPPSEPDSDADAGVLRRYELDLQEHIKRMRSGYGAVLKDLEARKSGLRTKR